MKGNLRERPPGSGVWRLRVYAGRSPSGRDRYASRTFRNVVNGRLEPGGRRRAESELARLVAEVDQGRHPSASTLGELLERWMVHIGPHRSPSTITGYRQKIDTAIRPALGSIGLTKLRGLDLDLFYRAQLDSGLSSTTVHHYHAIIHAALARGAKWGLVARNVADDADPPPLRRGTATSPAPEAVVALMTTAAERQPRLAMAVLLAAVTGARRGELCGLRWSDVDAIRHRLRIRGTKTDSSDRTISLSARTIESLVSYQAWQQDVADAARVEMVADPYLLATDPRGAHPLRPNSVTQAIRRLSGGAVHIHQLRHFQATQLLGAGMDVRTVAGRLGHADASTTLRVYAHFIEERDQVAAEHMDGVLGLPTPDQDQPQDAQDDQDARQEHG